MAGVGGGRADAADEAAAAAGPARSLPAPALATLSLRLGLDGAAALDALWLACVLVAAKNVERVPFSRLLPTMLGWLRGASSPAPAAAAAALELDVLVALEWRLGPFFKQLPEMERDVFAAADAEAAEAAAAAAAAEVPGAAAAAAAAAAKESSPAACEGGDGDDGDDEGGYYGNDDGGDGDSNDEDGSVVAACGDDDGSPDVVVGNAFAAA